MLKFTQTNSGDITVRIPGSYLRHTVEMMDQWPEGTRVTHAKTFSDAVLLELESEEDDGTTLAHVMLDQAIANAIENGCEGVRLPEDD